MTFLSDLFGGGDQTQRTTSTTRPIYPAQATPMFGHSLQELLNLNLPLQESLYGQAGAEARGDVAGSPTIRGAGMAGPASGAGGLQVIDPQVQILMNALGPFAATWLSQQAGRERGAYSSLFQPTTETTTQTDTSGGGNPMGDALAIAQTGLMIAGLFCWVADALYGEDSIQAFYARLWVSEGWHGWRGRAFRAIYRCIGPWLAQQITKHPWLKPVVQPLFDTFVQRGWQYSLQRITAILR